MRRLLILTVAMTALFAGLSFSQGPLTNALNLMVRTDSNGALYVYGVAAGAQGPLRNLGNTMLRTYTGGLAVAIAAGSTIDNPGIAVTSTDGLVLSNSTASTAGVTVQQSPRLRFRSNVWDTTPGENNTNDFFIESVPSSGGTTAGFFKFGSSINGAAATYPMVLGSSGSLTVGSGVTVTSGGVTTAADSGYLFGSMGRIYNAGVVDGQFTFVNAGISAGVGFDVATDAIFKVRTRAQTGYATVDTLDVMLSGNKALRSGVTTVTAGGSTCGTSAPTIVGNNSFGKVTTGSVAPTVCVVTFSSTWTTAPACLAANETTSNLLRATSTATTLTMTGTMVAEDVLVYSCGGYVP